jgi:hypothetical protein
MHMHTHTHIGGGGGVGTGHDRLRRQEETQVLGTGAEVETIQTTNFKMYYKQLLHHVPLTASRLDSWCLLLHYSLLLTPSYHSTPYCYVIHVLLLLLTRPPSCDLKVVAVRMEYI